MPRRCFLTGAITALVLVSVIALLVGPWATSGLAAPVTRTYYIAADEVAWDYAPTGLNQITGEAFGEAENVFLQPGPDRIGRVYTKAIYREYTDATFATLKPRDAASQHLGILGPTLRGAVGDTIQVVFKNNSRFPVGVHPHGVFYLKNSEGAEYVDGTAADSKLDGNVPTGGTHTYNWTIPERSGPAANDGSSIAWMYHGHTNETADTNAGLIGAIIVTKAGVAKPDGSPTDVDREFINVFTVFDENASQYLDLNIETHAGSPATVNKEDDAFKESNLMHTINGLMYGNLVDLTMTVGDRVRWYLIGMGTEVDLHTPHWHGNTLVVNGMRTDVTDLLPMTMRIADMTTDASGTWLYHCHVNDHLDAGMITRFIVNSAGQLPSRAALPALDRLTSQVINTLIKPLQATR